MPLPQKPPAKTEPSPSTAFGAMKWDYVPMSEVPEPPPGSRSRYLPMYEALRAMPKGHSMRLTYSAPDAKELSYMRSQLNTMAKKDGKRLLSSRKADNSVVWFWLGDLDRK